MHAGMNTPDFFNLMDRNEENAKDLVAPTAVTRFNDSGEFIIDGTTFRPTHTAMGQIADTAGIRRDYWRKLASHDTGEAYDLLSRTYDYWRDYAGKSTARMFRTLNKHHDDGTPALRAVLSDRYLRLDNHQVAHALSQAASSSEFEFKANHITHERMSVKLTVPNEGVVDNPGLNDIVKLGLHITNSEVGSGAMRIEPMLYRLVCLNGMTSGFQVKELSYSRNHSGERLRVGNLSETTRELGHKHIISELNDVVASYANPETLAQIARDISEKGHRDGIGSPISAVQYLGREFALSEDEVNSTIELFLRDQKRDGRNLWTLSNSITEVANSTESYDRACYLEEAGGRVLSMSNSQWDVVRRQTPESLAA